MGVSKIDLYEALKRYYNHLFNTGYSKPNDLEKLLIYIFIEELYEYPMSSYIKEEDYNIIGNALNCLYGSTCALSYPETKCSSYFLNNEY